MLEPLPFTESVKYNTEEPETCQAKNNGAGSDVRLRSPAPHTPPVCAYQGERILLPMSSFRSVPPVRYSCNPARGNPAGFGEGQGDDCVHCPRFHIDKDGCQKLNVLVIKELPMVQDHRGWNLRENSSNEKAATAINTTFPPELPAFRVRKFYPIRSGIATVLLTSIAAL